MDRVDTAIENRKSWLKKILDDTGKYQANQFPEELKNAIYAAMQTDDTDLRIAAAYCVHVGLERFEQKIIIANGIRYSDDSFNDYMQDMYLMIASSLEKWDPAYSLTTFFEPRFQFACRMERENSANTAFDSKYYEKVYFMVQRAITSLRQRNITNPTTLQIHGYLIEEVQYECSLKTIEECMQVVKDIASLDVSDNALQSHLAPDPLTSVLKNEQAEMLRRVIDGMELQYRIIMEIEMALYEMKEYQDEIPDDVLAALYSKYTETTVSADWIHRQRLVAENKVMMAFTERKVSENTPVNRMLMSRDRWQADVEDIDNAIDEIGYEEFFRFADEIDEEYLVG